MATRAHPVNERIDRTLSKRPPELKPVPEIERPAVDLGKILQRTTLAPNSLRPAELLHLQRTLGNRAVGALLTRPAASPPQIQAKLTVNAPGDEYEREADRVAAQVMGMPAGQREACEEDNIPEVITKRASAHTADGAFEAGEDFEQQLRASLGQGELLPAGLREELEAKFNTDFSGVRIHTDSHSAEMNQVIQARAFTHGRDIYLGAGQYASGSDSGKRLLAHELTHVVQQQGTALPCIQTRRNITDQQWSDYLPSNGKKETVEKNYQESERRGKQTKQSYNTWLANKQDKKGQTKALRAKGYRASAKDTDSGSFRMKTARWLKLSATVKENKMIEAIRDESGANLVQLLADKKFDIQGPLKVIEKKFQGERKTLNKSYDFVSTKEEMSAWEISGQDNVGNNKALVAKPDGFGDVTVMEFSGEATAVKEQYKNRYDLSERRLTAEENYKDQEPEQVFAASNSEILWMHYKAALAKAQSNVGKIEKKGNLTEVVRENVVNKQTLDTIFLCDEGGTVDWTSSEAIVTPDKGDFWALLGTPNGTAPGYLLIDHGAALGFEGFDSIHYLKNQLRIKYRLK